MNKNHLFHFFGFCSYRTEISLQRCRLPYWLLCCFILKVRLGDDFFSVQSAKLKGGMKFGRRSIHTVPLRLRIFQFLSSCFALVWHYFEVGILLCLKTCLKTYYFWYEILICLFSYLMIVDVVFSSYFKMVWNVLLIFFILSRFKIYDCFVCCF